MALVPTSRWQYFCGGNVTVMLQETVIGEAVAIGYDLNQNRLPLYGYNSPEFNAVADGNVIVMGKLAINYVSHEYLLGIIRSIINRAPVSLSSQAGANPNSFVFGTAETNELIASGGDTEAIKQLQDLFWLPKGTSSAYNGNLETSFGRPDQHNRGVDIDVIYGDIVSSGVRHKLKNVFFTGRSMDTIISEDPCIETFNFLARSVI
jgi:hypothetical protein